MKAGCNHDAYGSHLTDAGVGVTKKSVNFAKLEEFLVHSGNCMGGGFLGCRLSAFNLSAWKLFSRIKFAHGSDGNDYISFV
jgi:hypothetical protein